MQQTLYTAPFSVSQLAFCMVVQLCSAMMMMLHCLKNRDRCTKLSRTHSAGQQTSDLLIARQQAAAGGAQAKIPSVTSKSAGQQSHCLGSGP